MRSSFKKLGLTEKITSAVKSIGFETPTPVQEQVIPLLIKGIDVKAAAQTGTGKTAAFALPLLQKLQMKPIETNNPRTLILAPTRELATQIAGDIEKYSANLDLKILAIFGKAGIQAQIESLNSGVDILIATPGRLLDLHQQEHIDLSSVELLIIDEADLMLDMGFIDDVSKIVKLVTNRRQTLLFSATLPREIETIAADWLSNPVTANIVPDAIPIHLIQQSVYYVENINKDLLLIQYLFATPRARTLVFVRTKQDAERVSRNINRAKLEALPLHGNKSQGRRRKSIEAFKSEQAPILVATDVAARGLDIDNISHVINYALPEYPEIYIHRVGRTGRAGSKGEAISLCASHERYYLEQIEKLADIKINRREWNYDDFGNLLQLERSMPAKRASDEPIPRSMERIRMTVL